MRQHCSPHIHRVALLTHSVPDKWMVNLRLSLARSDFYFARVLLKWRQTLTGNVEFTLDHFALFNSTSAAAAAAAAATYREIKRSKEESLKRTFSTLQPLVFASVMMLCDDCCLQQHFTKAQAHISHWEQIVCCQMIKQLFNQVLTEEKITPGYRLTQTDV